MQKPILITGGAGYIGSHTVLELNDQGYDEVIVIDNLSTGKRELVPNHIPFYKADVQDHTKVKEIINKHKIQSIIHFAGSVIVPESVVDPIKYYTNNTVNSLQLIQTAVECNIRAFLFSSTAAVYGVSETIMVNENCPLNPITPYGQSKLMTENMLRDIHKATNLSVGILRYFNVAGADPKGRSGQIIPNATHLIKVICEVAAGKRPSIDIYGTDYPTKDGTGVRDFIHVTDLAKAHILTLKKLLSEDSQCFIANCGYGNGYSVLDAIHTAQEICGREIVYHKTPRRDGDIPALIADNTLIKESLEWLPNYEDLNQIIGSSLAWEKHGLR